MTIRHFFASLLLSFGLGACTTPSKPTQPETPAGVPHVHADGSVQKHGPAEPAHSTQLGVRQGYYH